MRVVSQGLKKLVLRLQLTHGHNIFHLLERGGFLHLQNNSGNVHQTVLSRYFREELWGKIWGKAYPRELPWLWLGHTLAMKETPVPSLGREKENATHSSILAWEIPWTEELGGLLSKALQSRTRLRNCNKNSIKLPPNISVLSWKGTSSTTGPYDKSCKAF